MVSAQRACTLLPAQHEARSWAHSPLALAEPAGILPLGLLQVPAVVVLDMLMLVTSLLPALFPSSASELSSFLSNYNFSRLFVEFVFESLPQTVLQS